MSIWDDLDKEASVDDRIGNHQFTVDKVSSGMWPSGDAYYELDGRLTTANNFNLRQRFSPAPSEEDVVANDAFPEPWFEVSGVARDYGHVDRSGDSASSGGAYAIRAT